MTAAGACEFVLMMRLGTDQCYHRHPSADSILHSIPAAAADTMVPVVELLQDGQWARCSNNYYLPVTGCSLPTGVVLAPSVKADIASRLRIGSWYNFAVASLTTAVVVTLASGWYLTRSRALQQAVEAEAIACSRRY